jgi:hypothetical protein
MQGVCFCRFRCFLRAKIVAYLQKIEGTVLEVVDRAAA